MRLPALADAGLGAALAAQVAVALGIVAFVGEGSPDPGHDGESSPEQTLEQDGVVHIGRRGHAGDRHATAVDRDVVLGPPLRAVGRVGAGQLAATLGAHRATVHDQVTRQVRLPAQHADQHGMHMPQHASLRPVRQPPAQGGPARHALRRPQAAPRRALAQEPPQGRQHPHRLGRRMAGTEVGERFKSADHPRNQLQDALVQRCPPRQRTVDGIAGRRRRGQAFSTQSSSENRL